VGGGAAVGAGDGGVDGGVVAVVDLSASDGAAAGSELGDGEGVGRGGDHGCVDPVFVDVDGGAAVGAVEAAGGLAGAVVVEPVAGGDIEAGLGGEDGLALGAAGYAGVKEVGEPDGVDCRGDDGWVPVGELGMAAVDGGDVALGVEFGVPAFDEG